MAQTQPYCQEETAPQYILPPISQPSEAVDDQGESAEPDLKLLGLSIDQLKKDRAAGIVKDGDWVLYTGGTLVAVESTRHS